MIPITKAFKIIVGTGANHLYFLNLYVKKAATKVVRLPNIISITWEPPMIFAKKQPMNIPGTAAGVKTASTQSASAILNCIGP